MTADEVVGWALPITALGLMFYVIIHLFVFGPDDDDWRNKL